MMPRAAYCQPGFEPLPLGEEGFDFEKAAAVRRVHDAVPFVGPQSPHLEVSQAVQSAAVLDMLGRALVCPFASSAAEGDAEAAQERAAIVAEGRSGVRTPGLVSVPTSGPERAKAMMEGAAVALRRHKGAIAPEEKKNRLARLRRSVGFAARGHIGAPKDGHRADYVAMLTLTYRGASEAWEPRHLSDCLAAVRKWMARRGVGFRYVWVAELQKRGVIHYHVALWLPVGFLIPKADRRGWWPHGASNIKAARAAVPYLMKYLSKGTDMTGFPKGARVHGCGGLDFAVRRAKRWLALPSFVQARGDVFDAWERARGGGWYDPDGVCIPSEFARGWVGDRFACIRVADHGRPFDASGPFTWLSRRGELAQ